MKTNKLMMVLPALCALGCSSPAANLDGGTNDGGTADMAKAATPDMAMIPAAPVLGTQIDRMGRPAINTAVTNPFDLPLSHGAKDAAKDAYNADNDPSKWVANWSADFQANLAVYDGADTVCGNQLAAGMTPTKGRYKGLGDILADDRLWVDSSQTACALYLGVEAKVLGLAVMDCGGRTLTENVIDESYTALTVGVGGFKGDGTFAVTNGVTKDGDGTQSMTFPFLGAPN